VTADALALLAANACYAVAGLGVLRLLGGWRRLRDVRLRLGLAYMTGVAAVGTIMTLLLVAGAALSVWEFLLLCGALGAAGLAGRGGDVPAELRAGRDRPVVLALVVLTASLLVLLAVDLAFQPLWAPDAWIQWTPKAKAIVLFGGLRPDFLRVVFNSDYPQLVPALEAVDFRFMGGFDTQVIHLQWLCLLGGFVLAIRDLLADRVRPLVLWIVLATVVFAPAVSIQSAYAYADLPFASFFALAGVAAWRWLEDGRRLDLGLLAIFSAAALATKVEAVIYVAGIFVVVGALAVRRLVPLALAGAVALLGIVPWRIWARAHGLHDYYGATRGTLSGLGRIPTSAVFLGKEIADPTSWLSLVLLGLVAAVLSLRARRTREAALLLGPPALAFVGLVWVYWHTPLELHHHLETSARRVIDGIVLLWAALAPIALERSLREGTGAGSDSR
jgi:hypothetical protein